MVIAYLRVSTGKQHLENQQAEINRYAQIKGITVDRWVTETISGKTLKHHRKLGNVLKSLRSGDTLIVTELSRLSRTLHEVMSIMGRCLERNITVYSTKDGYSFDDSINSKVLSFAFGLVAEIEHKLISQRTKEALQLRKAEGVVLGRRKGDSPKLKIPEDNLCDVAKMIERGHTEINICRFYGVSRDTFRALRRKDKTIEKLLLKQRRLKSQILERRKTRIASY
ncbi:MAG: recombinase family protein [Mucinivorans sp.]